MEGCGEGGERRQRRKRKEGIEERGRIRGVSGYWKEERGKKRREEGENKKRRSEGAKRRNKVE